MLRLGPRSRAPHAVGLLCDRGPVAHHLDEIEDAHRIGRDVGLGVVRVSPAVAIERALDQLGDRGIDLERAVGGPTVVHPRQPGMAVALAVVELAEVVRPPAIVELGATEPDVAVHAAQVVADQCDVSTHPGREALAHLSGRRRHRAGAGHCNGQCSVDAR
jgi:hypothetical protein